MIVHWLAGGVDSSGDPFAASSPLATNRYRAILPARALKSSGLHVDLIETTAWDPNAIGRPDVLVLGKLLKAASETDADFDALSRRVLDGARRLSRQGTRVIADFNDNHFSYPDTTGPHCRASASLADVCVASTEAMARVVRMHTLAPVVVIGDPLGSPKGKARVFEDHSGLVSRLRTWGSSAALKLVWYGNKQNWPSLTHWLDRLAPLAAVVRWSCVVVTSRFDFVDDYVARFNEQHAPKATVEWVEWSEQAQWNAVRDADVVLVPSDTSSEMHKVKSTNRVADAMSCGRYVVASPLESYQAFDRFVDLTDSPESALLRYLDKPDAARIKIEMGQRYVEQQFGVDAIGRAWRSAIMPMVPPASGLSQRQPDALRLNLGCGDKILDGYVNVDVVASRAGRKPDVICDLHHLTPFADDSADEVMAIHVVEHFWRWEIEAVLAEWVRVLRPGGRMVIECPNLQTACAAFLEDPDRHAMEREVGARSMWVFYGDPSWKDPYMVHRWGYTPTSLSALLTAAGLHDVRQEPAEYKLREPRDMRVVGYKRAPI